MKSFSARRWRNLSLFAFFAVALIAAKGLGTTSLHATANVSGWVLLAFVVFLTLYNVRKKFTAVPLGSSSAWLQVHIYVGLLAIVVFGLHVDWRIPNGIFESLLAALFVTVAGSGIVGLFLSRTLAPRLTTRGPEVMFERIPLLRRRLQVEVEDLVLRCLEETESKGVPTFYHERLRWFFEKPRYFFAHLAQSRRPRQRLLVEMESQQRYYNDAEQKVMEDIIDRVCRKDDLDYQYTLQFTLKYWLFIHIPLTYALLVYAAFHVVLATTFSGGIR